MFDSVIKPVVELLNNLMTPLLAIVGAAGALYCVILGVKYAKALAYLTPRMTQYREKAKGALKNAIIGYVLIFVLLVVLKLVTPVLTEWVQKNAQGAI